MLKFFLATALLVCTCNAAPELVLYNTGDRAAATFIATTNIGSDNQLCLPNPIKASGVCVNSGIWILYPDTNFLANTAPANIYYTGPEGPQTCTDLPDNLNKKLGSYRPAGDPSGASNCTLNLYVNTLYAADEKLVAANAPEVPYAFNSVIRAGDCQWQFYMKEGYEGFSECLRGVNEADYFVPDFTARFGVQAGDIKSIRQGCDKPTGFHTKRHYKQF